MQELVRNFEDFFDKGTVDRRLTDARSFFLTPTQLNKASADIADAAERKGVCWSWLEMVSRDPIFDPQMQEICHRAAMSMQVACTRRQQAQIETLQGQLKEANDTMMAQALVLNGSRYRQRRLQAMTAVMFEQLYANIDGLPEKVSFAALSLPSRSHHTYSHCVFSA